MPPPQYAPPEPLRGVLFDLDGTLVDTEPLHHESTNRVLAAHGHSMSEADFAPFIGTAEDAFWAALQELFKLPGSPLDYPARRTEAFLALLGEAPLEPLPGARRLLQHLTVTRVPCAVASSSPRVQIDGMLRRAGLDTWISACRSGHDDVARGKPHPDVYLEAAAALGVPAADCVAVEDSAPGVAAARAAGAFVVAVACPSHPDPDLGMAHWQLRSLTELLERLRTGPGAH